MVNYSFQKNKRDRVIVTRLWTVPPSAALWRPKGPSTVDFLSIFPCAVADYFNGKREGKGKSNGFPGRLADGSLDSHYEAEQAYHYGQGIFFGQILLHGCGVCKRGILQVCKCIQGSLLFLVRIGEQAYFLDKILLIAAIC